MSNELNKLKYLSGLTESYEDVILDGDLPEYPGSGTRTFYSPLERELHKVCKHAEELVNIMNALPEKDDMPGYVRKKLSAAVKDINEWKNLVCYLQHEVTTAEDFNRVNAQKEGNAFTAESAVNALNAFTAALANTEKGEEFEVGGKTFTNRTDIG